MVSAILADVPSAHPADSAGQFAPVLARYTADDVSGGLEKAPEVARLADVVTQARRDYQACRYSELIKYLPALLARLHSACTTLDGESRLRAYALAADAHHVAAGLLLKLDDGGLAYLAADRSMQAAQASGDPVTVGASARIITHTLMNGGHLDAAISTASTHAQALDHEISAHTRTLCPSTDRYYYVARSPPLSTRGAAPHWSCWARPTTRGSASAWTVTSAGPHSGQPTRGCTASTSP